MSKKIIVKMIMNNNKSSDLKLRKSGIISSGEKHFSSFVIPNKNLN